MMDIYRNGLLFKSVEVDDNSTYQKSLLQFDKITLSFTLEQYTGFEIGDYINIEDKDLNGNTSDTKYYLFETPQEQRDSVYSFKYTLVFSGKMHRLENATFLLGGDSSFFFRGTRDSAMTLMRINLQRVFGPTVNALSAATASNDIYDLDFNSVDCLSALKLISETFGTEFEFYEPDKESVRLVDLKGSGSDNNLYAFKNGVRKITSKPLNSKELITRMYVFGSERNIDFNSYGNKRLKLQGLPYVENNVNLYGVKEGVEIIEEVYPRKKGNVTAITQQSTTYKFTDTSMDFDLNSFLLQETAKITFNSGDLTGYEFEIASYDANTKEFEIIKFTDDQDLTLPNSTINMAVGDDYVIHDIKMPPTYISNAETELGNIATGLIAERSNLVYEYSVEVDPVKIREMDKVFDIGDTFSLDLSDISKGIQTLRIISFTRKVNKNREYVLKLSVGQTQSRLNRILDRTKTNESLIRREALERKLQRYRSRT